ncbi:hypothetical protein ACQEU3_41435 [Spirillospora sp. CA-253888]
MTGAGLGWVPDALGENYVLTAVRGATRTQLAQALSDEPVMNPDVFAQVAGDPRYHGLPDFAMLGETECGWAFAIGPPGGVLTRPGRVESLNALGSDPTRVYVCESEMDPVDVGAFVGERLDWTYNGDGYVGTGWDHDMDDHPLTRRLVAEAGLVLPSEGDEDLDEDDDPEPPDIAEVLRLLGEHYGLSLPREDVEARRLHAVFTEPRTVSARVYQAPEQEHEPCPNCGTPLRLAWAGDDHGFLYSVACPRSVTGPPRVSESVGEERIVRVEAAMVRSCHGPITRHKSPIGWREVPNAKYAKVPDDVNDLAAWQRNATDT